MKRLIDAVYEEAQACFPKGRIYAAWEFSPPSFTRTPATTSMLTCGEKRCPSPGAVGPASRLRRRYADAPAAALLTGLGAAELPSPPEWQCPRCGHSASYALYGQCLRSLRNGSRLCGNATPSFLVMQDSARPACAAPEEMSSMQRREQFFVQSLGLDTRMCTRQKYLNCCI